MAIATGQKAPLLSLYDTEKQPVKIGDPSDQNVLLLFFPLAFTSVCSAELCSIRDNIASYNNMNAQVFGISVDSLFTLDKFKAEQNLNFPLLSDFNKEASKAFDVLYDTFPAFEMQGVSKRAAFIIDKSGIVQYSEECATPRDQPDFKAIQDKLAELQ